MKKFLYLLLITALMVTSVIGIGGCSKKQTEETKQIVIAIPNDSVKRARALFLLQENGYIELNPTAGANCTISDIKANPHNIVFQEVDAANISSVRSTVDYVVIDGIDANNAGLAVSAHALKVEGATYSSAYQNVVVVKDSNNETDAARALNAALHSQQVWDYINMNYNGSVIPLVSDLTNGYRDDINYDVISGATISIVANSRPEAEILGVAADILAARNVTLNIILVEDGMNPNEMVLNGEVFANYCQDQVELDYYNADNGNELAVIACPHSEPMAIYGGTQTSLDALA